MSPVHRFLVFGPRRRDLSEVETTSSRRVLRISMHAFLEQSKFRDGFKLERKETTPRPVHRQFCKFGKDRLHSGNEKGELELDSL